MRVEVNKDGFAQSAQFDFKYNELYLNNSGLSVEDGNFKVSQLTTIMKPDDFGNPPYTIYRPEGINVTQYYRITSTNRGSGALLYDIATASPVDTTFALLISYEGMPVNSYVTYKIILFNSSVSATPNIYLSISTFKDDAMTITNDCIINGSPRNVLLNQYQVLNTTNTTFARAIVLDMFRGADDTQDYLMLSRAETI
jgi:hypothetical protein